MKKLLYLLIIFNFIACKDAPKPPPELEWSAPQPFSLDQSYLIVNGKNKDEIPDWVRMYLNSGERILEAFPQYQNSYVFVKEVQGSYIEPLKQWLAHFSLERDSPRLIAARAEARFLKSVITYPDTKYGDYFELAVKKLSDLRYDSIKKEDDFWIEKYIYKENGEDTQKNVFSFLVLITADKNSLQEQINAALSSVPIPPQASREQITSIQSIKDNFFVSF